MDPIQKFQNWHKEETQQSTLKLPNACCLSTIGLDGFPNARYVSFKEVLNQCWIITGPLNSRKGLEIVHNNKVALTFWWTQTERQVRIQGSASLISKVQADLYFKKRNRAAKIVSSISNQGEVINGQTNLEKALNSHLSGDEEIEIPRPQNWGGWAIQPDRIEFLEFRSTRLHSRELYIKSESDWNITHLQP